MDADDERRLLARVLRQRLEALGRAGLDRLPIPGPLPTKPAVITRPTRSIEPTVTRPIAPPSPQPTLSLESEAAPPTRPARPSIPPAMAASLFAEPTLEVVVPTAERAGQLTLMAAEVASCTKCLQLASTRTQTVFGEGSTTARLFFIGEAPGADEDRTGRPFVGRAGALLNDMITKGMGLAREEVYIANVLKSRPPENRTPTPEEMTNCLPYLERQIAIIRPEFLCLLGKTAASAILQTALPLGRLRGKWHRYLGIPTIVTYHPAALLRNPSWKRDTWEDLQTLMNAMGLKGPDRKRPGGMKDDPAG